MRPLSFAPSAVIVRSPWTMLLAAAAIALSRSAALAQSSDAGSDPALPPPSTRPQADITIAPYIWIPSLDGSVGVAGVTLDVDKSFIDIIEDSDTVFGLMGAIDLEYNSFVFQFNAAWTTVTVSGQRATQDAGQISADLKTNSTWVEFFGGYRFIDGALGDEVAENRLTLDAFIGGRVTSIANDLTLRSSVDLALPDGTTLIAGQPRDLDATEIWLDPFVGLRAGVALGKHWQIALRGDVGGFGAGSNFAWQGVGFLGYSWHHETYSVSLFGGYRAIGQDYSHDDFKWDVITHGPMLGLAIEF